MRLPFDRRSFLGAGLLVALLTTAVMSQTAQTATSVRDLVGQGYAIAGSFPIESGYGVFLAKGADLMLCQINFDAARSAFTTAKCYPVF